MIRQFYRRVFGIAGLAFLLMVAAVAIPVLWIWRRIFYPIQMWKLRRVIHANHGSQARRA